MTDPVTGENVTGFFLYDMALDPRLSEYIGLLVIDWGLGYRSWTQRAENQDKPVIELRRKLEEERFPGYLRFICQLSEIPSLYPEWIDRLKEMRGIYLLTCPRTENNMLDQLQVKTVFMGAGCSISRWRRCRSF